MGLGVQAGADELEHVDCQGTAAIDDAVNDYARVCNYPTANSLRVPLREDCAVLRPQLILDFIVDFAWIDL